MSLVTMRETNKSSNTEHRWNNLYRCISAVMSNCHAVYIALCINALIPIGITWQYEYIRGMCVCIFPNFGSIKSLKTAYLTISI